MRLDSSVCVVTGYGLDDQNSIPGKGWDIPPLYHVQTGYGNNQVPMKWVSGDLSPEGGRSPVTSI
jgi:hypothetical protein